MWYFDNFDWFCHNLDRQGATGTRHSGKGGIFNYSFFWLVIMSKPCQLFLAINIKIILLEAGKGNCLVNCFLKIKGVIIN